MNRIIEKNKTPQALGFRMPAEWEPHEATWLSWPVDRVAWPKELPELELTYLQIIEELSKGEAVHLLIPNEPTEDRISAMLRERGVKQNVRFFRIPTVSNWIRDYGPIFLKHQTEGRLALSQFRFNAWGGKSKTYAVDEVVPEKLKPLLGLETFRGDFVLEGGSVEVNGSGILLTTEQCLLNKNRNPRYTKKQIEQLLKDFLGVHEILWLAGGIAGDDTDGHVDTIARFVNEHTIAACLEVDATDVNCGPLRRNWKRLVEARSSEGKKFDLISLPMPGKVGHGESRYPASYANFYIGNSCVLVPAYDRATDEIVLDIFRNFFPGRKVVAIEGIPLIYGRGSIHCATQPQPLAQAS